MKTFSAVRKPIYLTEVSASTGDFAYTIDLFEAFIAKHSEYKDCKYDKDLKDGVWTIRLYRECAIDFVEP